MLGAVATFALAGCSVPSGGDAPADDAGDAAPPRGDARADAPRGEDDASADAAREDASRDGRADAPDSARDGSDEPDAADAALLPDTAPLDTDGDGFADTIDCAPADKTRWQTVAYSYRDADGDTYTVAESGTVCAGSAFPPGYRIDPIGDDCDDTNPNVYMVLPIFADTDGDGVGAGASQAVCVGGTAPPGQSFRGDDCAPADASAWQMLQYAYRDADGDSYTVGTSGQLCAGVALPAGYATIAHGDDCDDGNPRIWQLGTYYADADSDGVGAGAGLLVCTDGSVPTGDSSSDSDCAPNDPARWRMLPYAYVDRDGDGATIAEAGSVCAGASLPPPYFATAHGNDCDDGNASLTHWDIVYPDADGDGAGALPLVIQCSGAGGIAPGYSRYGDDEDDTNASVGPLPPEDILDLVLL